MAQGPGSKREAPLVAEADKELEESQPAQRRKEAMHAAEADDLNRAKV